MNVLRSAVIGATLLATQPSLAADTTSGKTNGVPEGVHGETGLHMGTGGGSGRLGKSLDIAYEIGLRKKVGAFVLGGALRPHYERYAFGDSDVGSCEGAPSPCGPAAIVRSQLSAHAFGVEVPFTAELPVTKTTIFPYIGVAPGFGYLRATDTRQGMIPMGEHEDQSSSRTYFSVAAFGGGAIKLSDSASFLFRVGYRFAPTWDDLPGGGSSSARGVLASFGFRVLI